MTAPLTHCPVTGKVNTFSVAKGFESGTTLVACSQCGERRGYDYLNDEHDLISYADWCGVVCADAAELHMDEKETA